ncbi:MAG: Cthe_2314 family HEPN domain-containing protein [Nitrospirales bacterium]|nr:Cthe_2314 family HEPN domain-containing protein [Nitrospirales bacterium]
MNAANWSDLFQQLPKPHLSHFFTKSTESEFLSWIKCPKREVRALAYLWLSDIVTLELEIRRAVAEAQSVKGLSLSGDPEAAHALFRYHADNACYRTFALLDKASQLLNAYLGLKVERPSFKAVVQKINKSSDLSQLESVKPFLELESSEWYKALSGYRHSLSHRLSPVGQDQTSLLALVKGLAQYLEFKPVGYSIEQLESLISGGHKRVVVIIEASEAFLRNTPAILEAR